RLHATKLPKRPVRSTSSPLPHSGHFSPVSFGFSITLPSSARAPSHSGYFAHERNLPPRPSFQIIGPPQVGHGNSAGPGPRSVTFATSFLESTSLWNGP